VSFSASKVVETSTKALSGRLLFGIFSSAKIISFYDFWRKALPLRSRLFRAGIIYSSAPMEALSRRWRFSKARMSLLRALSISFSRSFKLSISIYNYLISRSRVEILFLNWTIFSWVSFNSYWSFSRSPFRLSISAVNLAISAWYSIWRPCLSV
jgi:hypothetical protein